MDRFRIISRLGAGGFGEAFRAWDTAHGVPVVLKRPLKKHLQRPDVLARFDREINRLLELTHPHIVPIIAHGHDSTGLPYLAMRFLPAGSLADRKKPHPFLFLHRWLPSVAAALDHVHAHGIVHRDVKPANIFFDTESQAYLGDFGIAKVIDEDLAQESEHSLTSTGGDIGTYPYMGPEFFHKPRVLSGAYDQYALAVSVYEMICGRRPFSGDSGQLVVAHVTQAPPDVRRFSPDAPASLCGAIMRALSKKPLERFGTCAEFAEAALQDISVVSRDESVRRFLCPGCHKLVKVPTELGGRNCRCPDCSARLRVSEKLDALWLKQEDPSSIGAHPSPAKSSVAERSLTNTELTNTEFSTRLYRNWDEVPLDFPLDSGESTTRQTLRRLRIGAMVLATVFAVAAAGLWMRASVRATALATRASALAAALQTEAWDAALAIEPDNVAALVGRARRKLQVSPPDIDGAFSDLDRASRCVGSADATAAVRADAHSVRAREQARGGQLEAAMRDIATSDGGGGSPELLAIAREAIAAGWLERARTASSKGDTAALKQAVTSAGNFGVEQPTVLTVWQDYGRARIAALDASGLALACSEGGKLGLSRDQQAAWWVEFAELASTTPAKDAALVRTAIDAAKAAGASDEVVSPLRGSALMVEASSFTKGGDMKSAAAKAIEAMMVDTVGPVATLLQPANRSLREAVVKDYRERFHVGVAGNDWDAVLRVATAALALEPTATDWMGEALATHPDGLAAVPAEVLGRLPVSVFASLPPAKLPTIRNSIGIELKLLPAGKFMMGPHGFSPETLHQVTLTKPFYIGVYEMTNAQWKQVMGNVPSDWKDDDRPVENVSWNDAVYFCQKLSALPEEVKAGRVYRLPTEAEWEYACRAGSNTKYSFGDDESQLGEYGWFYGNSGSMTHPVGKKKPNAWGLYDMHGNVCEWCSDGYGDYPKGAVTNPQGSSGASPRVHRGGCWRSGPFNCRSSNRDWDEEQNRHNFPGLLGFRLALSPSGVEPPEAEK